MEWIEQQIHKLHFLVIDQIGRKSKNTSMLMFCLRIVLILPQKRQFLVHKTLLKNITNSHELLEVIFIKVN